MTASYRVAASYRVHPVASATANLRHEPSYTWGYYLYFLTTDELRAARHEYTVRRRSGETPALARFMTVSVGGRKTGSLRVERLNSQRLDGQPR